jgi:uncharacterized protein (TIGR03083 family)
MSDETMMWDEVADIGALLHELDDEAFDAPSLCDGWAVRDVLGHMGLGHTTSMPAMIARISRYAFNVTRASSIESRTLFAGQSADEIRRFWDEVMIARHPRKGISRLIPPRSGFLDHLIHNQDIRCPAGQPRTVPEARLHRALHLVRTEASLLFSPAGTSPGSSCARPTSAGPPATAPLWRGPGRRSCSPPPGARPHSPTWTATG